LSLKLAEEEFDNKRMKKKLWTNRSLAGVTTIIAILALL